MNLTRIQQTLNAIDRMTEDEVKLMGTQLMLQDPERAATLLDTIRTEFELLEKELAL
jgi:hypothetical protein